MSFEKLFRQLAASVEVAKAMTEASASARLARTMDKEARREAKSHPLWAFFNETVDQGLSPRSITNTEVEGPPKKKRAPKPATAMGLLGKCIAIVAVHQNAEEAQNLLCDRRKKIEATREAILDLDDSGPWAAKVAHAQTLEEKKALLQEMEKFQQELPAKKRQLQSQLGGYTAQLKRLEPVAEKAVEIARSISVGRDNLKGSRQVAARAIGRTLMVLSGHHDPDEVRWAHAH
ncbi:hypothetical protein KKG24_04295 [Patescibacteria group bacterium]|nr:hypothetical protein [Patescibacteria group bacterium]